MRLTKLSQRRGTPATALVTFNKVPTVGRKITIGSTDYVYGTDFLPAREAAEVAFNFAAAVNSDPDETTRHTQVSPIRDTHAVRYGNKVRIIATVPGVAGDDIELSQDEVEVPGTQTEVSVSSDHLGGGVDL